jgi:cytochrome c oxidase subunit 3
MSLLSPVSSADISGGNPIRFGPTIGCDETEFPALLRRYRLGLALFVAAVAMLFVGFSSAYVVRRGIPTYDARTGAYSTAWEPLRLPVALLFLNTCLLVGASGALEVVRRRVRVCTLRRQDFHRGTGVWLSAALLLGTGFLVGQGIAWDLLSASGQLLTSGARTAFFYVLTGTHAVHAVVGILAVMAIAAFRARMCSLQSYLAVDLAAWYVHSMTLLWVYLLCFLLLG